MAFSESSAVVLIVEDEFLLRMAAVDFIAEAGFQVLEAKNADDAVRLLESRDDIRLVFTDIDMPLGSMNGLKLAHAVRDRWPPIAIIVVSGHRIPDEGDMPLHGRFFTKPYNEQAMVATMHDMLKAA
jgi:DNA-binding NtrC family response regulator